VYLKKIEEGTRLILEGLGEDLNRPGLKDTPKRVVSMCCEIFRGYDKSKKPIVTCFDNGCDGINYDEMIFDSGYFYSHCEHHMTIFNGDYFFAYIPDKKIIGLSKVARIIDYFAAKLQVQERLNQEIVNEIENVLHPKGCALILRARHFCKEMRGVKKVNGVMTTSVLRGVIKNNAMTRAEFISFLPFRAEMNCP